MLLSDFLMMLMLFDEVVKSKSLRARASSELHALFDVRITQHKEFFSSSNELISFYLIAKKVVDFVFPLPK